MLPPYTRVGTPGASRMATATLAASVVAALAVMLLLAMFVMRSGMEDGSAEGPQGTVQLSEILAVGMGLSSQAAGVIKEVKRLHLENMHVKGHTAEGVAEPVTDADQRSNAIFVNGYRNHFPGIVMLSEEKQPAENATVFSSGTTLDTPLPAAADLTLDLKDLIVIVDPLDATKEFTENLLEYVTTMVCVVYQGRPIAGIINQVFEESPMVMGVIGTGPSGAGGILRGRPSRHQAEGEAAETVAISRSHTGAGEDVVTKYLPGHKSLQAGGAGFKALLVVDGIANAYVHVTKIKSWDVCAADAVLHTIGGGFTDADGQHLKYNTEDTVFTHGIVATQSAESQAWYLEHLGGNLE